MVCISNVHNHVLVHGVPEALISDRGPNLLSTLMQEVCEVSGMQKLNTTAYHPPSRWARGEFQ